MRTLDQERAEICWVQVSGAKAQLNSKFEEYRRLVKGAPALIMGNGLMATIAFYQSRNKEEPAKQLVGDLCASLVQRLADEKAFQPLPDNFETLMDRLHRCDSATYRHATDEALALLKWHRQFVDALKEKG